MDYKEKDNKSDYEVNLGPLKEEPAGIKKIKENYLFFVLISAILGVLCTISFYKNQSGINTPIFAIAWIACCAAALYKLEIKILKTNFIYMIAIMLFSISSMLTTNSFVLFFNNVGIILLISIMLLGNFYDVRKWQFGRFSIEILNLFGEAMMQIFAPFTHFQAYINSKTKKESKIKYVVIGLAISVPLVMIVLRLLISADSVFSSIFTNISEGINFQDIFGITVLFFIGSIGFYAVFAGLSYKKNGKESMDIKKGEPVIAITITSIMTVIYLVFCLIQIKYLFIGGANSLPEGLTYAEYARRGFFQIVFVSIINLGLVLICISVFRESKVLKVLLTVISVCTYVLIASSIYRMILYVGVYQLTFLRILVLWFLALLTVLMTGIIITIFNERFNLFRFSLTAVISFYLVFAFAKPDRIIAEYNLSHNEILTYSDMMYMVEELSYDATPVISKIVLREVDLSDGIYKGGEEGLNNIVRNYFEKVERNYNNRGVRGFNFSSFTAHKVAQSK